MAILPSVPSEFVWLVVFKIDIAISRILYDKYIESDKNVKYANAMNISYNKNTNDWNYRAKHACWWLSYTPSYHSTERSHSEFRMMLFSNKNPAYL